MASTVKVRTQGSTATPGTVSMTAGQNIRLSLIESRDDVTLTATNGFIVSELTAGALNVSGEVLSGSWTRDAADSIKLTMSAGRPAARARSRVRAIKV